MNDFEPWNPQRRSYQRGAESLAREIRSAYPLMSASRRFAPSGFAAPGSEATDLAAASVPRPADGTTYAADPVDSRPSQSKPPYVSRRNL